MQPRSGTQGDLGLPSQGWMVTELLLSSQSCVWLLPLPPPSLGTSFFPGSGGCSIQAPVTSPPPLPLEVIPGSLIAQESHPQWSQPQLQLPIP